MNRASSHRIRRATAGVALIASLLAPATALAGPEDITHFAGCIVATAGESIVLQTAHERVMLDLSRMKPSDAVLAMDECVTARAYRGSAADGDRWFAESIVSGDERVEFTGRDITRETTADSPARRKREKPD